MHLLTRWWLLEITHIRHSSWHTTWHSTHSTRHTSRCTTSRTISGSNNWSPHFLNLLSLTLILFSLCIWICINPINGLLLHILLLLLVIILNHIFKLCIIQCISHLICHVLQLILCLNCLPLLLILSLILFGICHNLINLLLTQSTLIRINGNLCRICRILLVLGSHTQNTIRIQIKCNLNLWHTSWCRWNTHQFKLTQLVIVLCQLTLAFKYLNQDTRLIISIRGKCLICLAWDCLISLDQFSHDSACSLNTKRQWSHIQQQQVTSITHLVSTQDCCLNRGTIRHSLIRIDALARILTIEVLLNHCLNTRNTGRTAHQYNLVNIRLTHLGILQNLGNRFKTLTEVMHAEILKSCTSNRRRKVNAIIQRINLNVCSCCCR